jgi:hypothetical protein
MTQLTVRGIDERLEREIRQLASRERISLNRAALLLLRRGAGLGEEAEDPLAIGTRLDDFIGSWSQDEADAVEAATRTFEEIDPGLWR